VRRLPFVVCLCLLATSASAQVPRSRGGQDRVGQPAPGWRGLEALNGDAPSLESLRGEVVLVRFWTDTCPYCSASAPAFEQLDEDYRDRGLRVVGIWHPKPRGARRGVSEVRAWIRRAGWRFDVLLDPEWETLDRWWLDHGRRRATSVSFLVDREGVIRWVHPGPELHPGGPADHARCRADYADLRRAIEALL